MVTTSAGFHSDPTRHYSSLCWVFSLIGPFSSEVHLALDCWSGVFRTGHPSWSRHLVLLQGTLRSHYSANSSAMTCQARQYISAGFEVQLRQRSSLSLLSILLRLRHSPHCLTDFVISNCLEAALHLSSLDFFFCRGRGRSSVSVIFARIWYPFRWVSNKFSAS